MFGILDGHGLNGHFASEFVKKNLPTTLNSLVSARNEPAGTKPKYLLQGNKNLKHYLPPLAKKPSGEAEQEKWISSPRKYEMICEAFRLVNSRLEQSQTIDASFSGTTAVTVFLSNDQLICANAGDSRAIICSVEGGAGWKLEALSRDHKPEVEDEAERIRNQNGRIEQSKF